MRADEVDGGHFKIIETVTRLGAPISRKTRLCDPKTGRFIRQAWSDAETGRVVFNYLRPGPWLLYAIDYTEEFEGVIIQSRYATKTGAR
jgi:hypothetical protein